MTNVSYTLLFLHVAARCVSFAAAEDDAIVTESTQEEVLDVKAIATLYLLFAVCISLVGVSILYFSALEDALMKWYKEEGALVKATVVSSNFARSLSVAKADCSSKAEDVEQEYIVWLEYERIERHYTRVVIQKQVKATEKDFIEPRNSSSGNHVQVELPHDMSLGDLSLCRREMEVLVLPGYSKSGFPRRQIEKACSLRYRASSVILVMFMFALSGFYIHLAVADLYAQSSIWFVPAALFTMLSVETGSVHICLRNIFKAALREEYLESGGKKEMSNPSTISSRGGFVEDDVDDASFVLM